MENDIFRKEAIENLASPDKLDSMIQVINPLGWSILFTISLLFVSIAIWGFFGTISYKVYGEGMLLYPENIYDIFSTTSGEVNKILVKLDDIIKEGEIIAYVDKPDILKNIKILYEKLEELNSKYLELGNLSKKKVSLEKESLEKRYKSLKDAILRIDKQKKLYEDKIKGEKVLLNEGLITKGNLIETQERYNNLLNDYNEKENELKEILAKIAQLDKNLEEEKINLEEKINDTKRNLKNLEEEMKLNSVIISKVSGKVIEVKVNKGDYIEEGMPIITVESTKEEPKNLQAIIYVSIYDGKKITPNMDIQIIPSTVKIEEYGFIYGKVQSVSSFPTTPQSMMQVLRNKNLVESLSSKGVTYEIRGRLLFDDNSSNYKWSSKKGENIKIESGTYCNAMITVRKERPISLLIPLMKGIFSN